MATKLYPPVIDGSLPAFYKRYDTAGKVDKAEITIPFEMNRTVSQTDIYKIRLRLRTIATNTELVNIESTSLDLENFVAKFILNSSLASKFNEGQFYMAQIAFEQSFKDSYGKTSSVVTGYYSNLGTIKCVAKPSIAIDGFETEIANPFEQEIVGLYTQDTSFGDTTEKVNTYRFLVTDVDGNTVLDSGECLHNSSEDVSNYYSKDRFVTNHLLQEGVLYYLQYSVTTINHLMITSPTYLIMTSQSVDIEAKVKFHGEASYEEGYVKLWLQGDAIEGSSGSIHEEIITGTFKITRASDRDNYFTWDEILRFNLTGGYPSDYIFRDFTVEQGVPYKYRIQQYNIHDVESNPLYLTYSLDDEKAGLGKCGEEKIIVPDFEDMFLYDGERQLKIRFNPKVSSFKNTIPEQKIETIGSKYPFIFRNGQVCYKEFPIAGLLTFQSDNTISFLNMEEAETAGILTPIYGRGVGANTSISTTSRTASMALTYDLFINPIYDVDTSKNWYSFSFKNTAIGKINFNNFAQYDEIRFKLGSSNEWTYLIFDVAGCLEYDLFLNYINEIQIAPAHLSTTFIRRIEYAYESANDSSGHLAGGKDSYIVEYPAGAIIKKEDEFKWVPGSGYSDLEYMEVRQDKNLTSDNIMGERYFKLKVLNWLSDGEVKLFRSPTEGNYLVRLMNVSLSPQDALGRMIHQFTCTAYEIADLTYDNLIFYKIIRTATVDLMERQWASIAVTNNILSSEYAINQQNQIDEANNIDEADRGWYELELDSIAVDSIEFSDFAPNDKIRMQFDNSVAGDWEYIIIGQTGGYSYSSNSRYVIKMQFQPATEYVPLEYSRIITYSYEGIQIRKFDAISSIKTYVQVMLPFIGPIDNLLANYDLYNREKVSDGDTYHLVDQETEEWDNTKTYYIMTNSGYQQSPVTLVDNYKEVTTNIYRAWGENVLPKYYTEFSYTNLIPSVFMDAPNNLYSTLLSLLDDPDPVYLFSNEYGGGPPGPWTIENVNGERIVIVNDGSLQLFCTDSNDYHWWQTTTRGTVNAWLPLVDHIQPITDEYVFDPTHLFFKQDLTLVDQAGFIPVEIFEIIETDLGTHRILSKTYSWTENTSTQYYYLDKQDMIDYYDAIINEDGAYIEEQIIGFYNNNLNIKSNNSNTVYLGQRISFNPDLNYYTKTENYHYKKAAKDPSEIKKAIPYTINYSISPTLTKFHMNELDVLHVRKRDVVPIYALNGIITSNGNEITLTPTLNSSYCTTPFYNGYANQTIPYNLKQQIFDPEDISIPHYTVKVSDQIQYSMEEKFVEIDEHIEHEIIKNIIALNDFDVDTLDRASNNISKHSILKIYVPVLVPKNTPAGQEAATQQHINIPNNESYVAIDWIPMDIHSGLAYYDTNSQKFFDEDVDYEPFFAINQLEDDDVILSHSFVELKEMDTIKFTGSNYVSAVNTNMISLAETEEITLKHLGQLDYLHLGNGVMAELTGQMRVVDFLIEETVPGVAAAKAIYESIKREYASALTNYYNLYYSLQHAHESVDYYTQHIQELKEDLISYLEKVDSINELLESANQPNVFKQQVINSQNNLLTNIINTLGLPDVYGRKVTNSFNSEIISGQVSYSAAMVEFVGFLMLLTDDNNEYYITPNYYENENLKTIFETNTSSFTQNLSLRYYAAFDDMFMAIERVAPTSEIYRTIYNKINERLQYNEILILDKNNDVKSINIDSIGYWPFTVLLEPKELTTAADKKYWYCYPTTYGNSDIQVPYTTTDGVAAKEIKRHILYSLLTDQTEYNKVIEYQKDAFKAIIDILIQYVRAGITAAECENRKENLMITLPDGTTKNVYALIETAWEKALPYRIYRSLHETAMEVIVNDPGYLKTFALVVLGLSNDLTATYYETAGLVQTMEEFLNINRNTSSIYPTMLSNETFVQQDLHTIIDAFYTVLYNYATTLRNDVVAGIKTAMDASREFSNNVLTKTATVRSTYNIKNTSTANGIVYYVNPDDCIPESDNRYETFGYTTVGLENNQAKTRFDYNSLFDFTTKMRLLLKMLKTIEAYPITTSNNTVQNILLPISNNQIAIEDLQIWLQTLLKNKVIAAYQYWHKAATEYLDENGIDEITSDSLNLYFYTAADMYYKLYTNLNSYTGGQISAGTEEILGNTDYKFNKYTLYTCSPNTTHPATGTANGIYVTKENRELKCYKYNTSTHKWSLVCTILLTDNDNNNSFYNYLNNKNDIVYQKLLVDDNNALTDEQKAEQKAEIESRAANNGTIGLEEYFKDYYTIRSKYINATNETARANYYRLYNLINVLINLRKAETYEEVYNRFGFFNGDLWDSYIGTLTQDKDDLLFDFVQYVEDLLDYRFKVYGYSYQKAIYDKLADDPNSAVYQYEYLNSRYNEQLATVSYWQDVKTSCEMFLETETDPLKIEKLESTLSTANYKISYESIVLQNYKDEFDRFKASAAYREYLAEATKINIALKEVIIAYALLYGSEMATENYGEDYTSIQRENNAEVEIVGSYKTYEKQQKQYQEHVSEYLELMLDLRDGKNTIVSLGIRSLIDYWNEIAGQTHTAINLKDIEDKLAIYEAKQQELIEDIEENAQLIKDFREIYLNTQKMVESLQNLLKYYEGDPDTLDEGLIVKIREEIKTYEQMEKDAKDLIETYGDNISESVNENRMKDSLYEALSSFLSLVQHYYTTVIEERYGE